MSAEPEAVPERAANDGGDGGEQYVTFNVGSEVFAFPMEAVREIIRVPETLRVPLSPPTLNGVANLRGQVLPIVNLRRHFSFPDKADDAATRVIVVDDGTIVGFVVDSVASVITVQPGQREPVDALSVACDAEMLSGLLKGVGGHAMVMILRVERLVCGRRQTRAPGDLTSVASTATSALTPAADEGGLADERQLVSFVAAAQEYAFPIEHVQEIVQVPEHISEVPNAAAHVVGVMTLRNRLLPLVSLRRMFNLPFAALSPQQRIVVISVSGSGHAGGVVGIVMDAVKEVLRVPLRLVDGVPGFLRARGEASEVEAICRLDEGRRLVSVLSVEKLFQREALREALSVRPRAGEEVTVGERADDRGEGDAAEDEQLVVFRLADEEYGVRIDSVQEIIRMPESITHIPKAASFLAGIVNVRGAVLPIIDFRTRFGLEKVARNDGQRIVVLGIDGTRTGFIVDSVSQVLKVSRSAIERTPNATDEQSRIMGQIANLEQAKRMILILDARELLDGAELTAMRRSITPAAA